MTARNPLYTIDEIYRLLPEIYRVEDDAEGSVLRQLIGIITEQANVLVESIEQLYDDLFIETSAEWAVPYIGDLIGYRTLHGVVPGVASPRAEVANTIGYRRRKGTAAMLEQLARDVTGWPARVVEFFELLATTQYMNHVRDHAEATASVRGAPRLEIGAGFARGAFDGLAHTAEMRNIRSRSGRYNIPNIGIFLFRIGADELIRSPLVPADGDDRRYRFDQFGTDRRLYAPPRTEVGITHLAGPLDLPIPLTRRWVAAHSADYYPDSLFLEIDGASGSAPLPHEQIRICDLSDDPANPGAWFHEPQPGDTHVAIDPVLGRVAFPTPTPAGETRLATFHHGLALEIGGGGYDRPEPTEEFPPVTNVVTAGNGAPLGSPLGAVAGGGAVEIVDNHRYQAPATIDVDLPAGGAADRVTVLRSANRRRPHLSRGGQIRLVMEPDTTLIIEGLAIEGAPLVIEESADTGIRNLVLRHCTLVPGIRRAPTGDPALPGRASLIVLHPFASVRIDHCVIGPVVAVEDSNISVEDSIIDASARDEIGFCGRAEPAGGGLRVVSGAADRLTGDGLTPGGELVLESSTVVGKIHATRLDVSNSILLASLGAGDPWPAPVWAERRQVGCIRFSYLPGDSRTPQQFHCVPRPGVDVSAVPNHTSLRFGDAAYGQLRRSTHAAIRTGSEDESEMGVTRRLYEPQRETNLRIRLDEYLRFGLEAGAFYAT